MRLLCEPHRTVAQKRSHRHRENAAWTDAGIPQNLLGERWIDLGDSYGIHGTIDPESIGKADSRGCVRMHNEDVELVYGLLSVGSAVVIWQ